MMPKIVLGIVASLATMTLFAWLTLYIRGNRFARRDRLRRADAIIVLAGTRGNLRFLDGKIRTAVRLYQQGWLLPFFAAESSPQESRTAPHSSPLKSFSLL